MQTVFRSGEETAGQDIDGQTVIGLALFLKVELHIPDCSVSIKTGEKTVH